VMLRLPKLLKRHYTATHQQRPLLNSFCSVLKNGTKAVPFFFA
jgi:hypothetical protein